ncbi:von Willebrand factor C and EGF domain-containing protein isoform X2 [Sphaerodactylus townsendi]|uniref:von Willebrand factor C and EGF domain-containing protein isoform X2 n=1 Tax=Sphaerodactylus townsendi TaxID=933632 RepID=UPI002026D25C|nr:von Willebrand factor C and EGF domain-containing protein isoform X2 [Sphaerodactylus townsendi]
MFAELLFQTVCVSVFLQGAQGRVYTGRKKLANFAVERRRVGPHVCLSGFGSGCCPGWIPSPGSGQCTLPLCSFGCGSGLCIAPNVCSCRDGGQGITCHDTPRACGEYGCDLACNHGGCQEVARVCPLGFSMTETANGVRCADIDECLSASCEGLCVNTEGGFVCECGPGMQLSADRHSCQDTDECLATPCQHRCKNSIGSYRCSCQPGFYLHGNRHSCLDVNECRRPSEKRTCQHSCHNTMGSFMCSCYSGYRLSVDRVSCEGFSKASLAPSPILQSLQHPPTVLHLSPESMAPVQPPRGSPPSRAPAPQIVLTTQPPSSLLSISSTLPPAASPTHTFPASSPSFDMAPLLRTARPSVMTSHLPPSFLWEEVTLPPSPSTPSPTVSPASLPSICWHEGVPHENGSHWTEPGCLNCSCEGGQVLCIAVTCQITCSHPVPAEEGKCCPSCTGCLYDGIARAEGDVFALSEENCTVCVCLAGNVSCISPECTPTPCTSSPQTDCCPCQPAECHFRGLTYVEGAEFSLDGDDCTTCVCRQGEVECSFTPCPTLECPREDWLLAPGQCCYTCRKAASVAGCFVDDNGVEFPVGQIWSPGDPCELCICQADGSVSCKRTDCLETCPHPIRIPGQCCPDCSAGCTYAGKIVYNNETFPSILDPCLSCICLLGSVACSPVDCIVFCTYPFHSEGECCPVCHDCNYKGRKVVNGHTFVPEGEPCIQCTCQLGEVSCEKRPCPSICAEPLVPPIQCCPDCLGTKMTVALASLDNRLSTSYTGVEEAETDMQTSQTHSMVLMPKDNCSLCNSTSAPASLTPGVHLTSSNATTWKTQHATPTAPGNGGLHSNRPEDLSRLQPNRPPSVRLPSSWLGYSATPQIRSMDTLPLLSRAEGVRPHPTRMSSFGSPSTHSQQPTFITRTTGTSVISTAVYAPTPSTAANHTDPISGPVGPSYTPSFPLPPPQSASHIPDFPSQELPGSQSHTTDLPVGQQTVGTSPTLPPGDENDINSTDP